MEFHEKRRQQFLVEKHYINEMTFLDEVISGQEKNLSEPEGNEKGWHSRLVAGIAGDEFIKLSLQYTAGEPIDPLRDELEKVVAAYERYGEYLWKYEGDRNVPVFDFVVIDDYCQLMQIIGLCFLLHRRDLLSRVAALQDGLDAIGQVGEGNGGADALFEEFLIFGLGGDERYQSDYLCALKPYEPLFYALTEETDDERLKKLHEFLRRWYKELAGCGWHDSHIADSQGNQGGYYGYWSFEAGAAVILLGIEDDSSLHQYLYYPKDMVAWCRDNAHLSEQAPESFRCNGGDLCPKDGFWWTPARPGAGRMFKKGEIMPKFQSDYGITIWQWSPSHSEPRNG